MILVTTIYYHQNIYDSYIYVNNKAEQEEVNDNTFWIIQKTQRHWESVYNNKSLVKAITVDEHYPNLIDKSIPNIKISKVIMMNCYWEVENRAPPETRLCKKKRGKISMQRIMIWTSWTVKMISNSTQVIIIATVNWKRETSLDWKETESRTQTQRM